MNLFEGIYETPKMQKIIVADLQKAYNDRCSGAIRRYGSLLTFSRSWSHSFVNRSKTSEMISSSLSE